MPFPPPGDLADPGIETTTPVSPAVAGRFFTTESPGKPTMECSSAVKRNKFESVELMWVNLEPVTRSEVSQKEKNKCHILTHTSGI